MNNPIFQIRINDHIKFYTDIELRSTFDGTLYKEYDYDCVHRQYTFKNIPNGYYNVVIDGVIFNDKEYFICDRKTLNGF